jgi:PDZ domain-containing protein
MPEPEATEPAAPIDPATTSDAADPARRRLRVPAFSGRTWTLITSAFAVVGLTAAASILPVPYVALFPGPVTDTLGTTEDGTPVVEIKDHRTYPTGGRLDLTTVLEAGGPQGQLLLGDAVRAWLSKSAAVLPRDLVYPPGTTNEQVQTEQRLDMEQSQSTAKAAALCHEDFVVPSDLVVAAVTDGGPSDDVLKPGDVIEAVDGTPIAPSSCNSTKQSEQLRDLIGTREPGDVVFLRIRRDGDRSTVAIITEAGDDGDGGRRPVIGIRPAPSFTTPFPIEIGLDGVGGPSAGTMFALGIIDKITPGELNGGQHVAGTGTIDVEGNVGRIGGIQQKLAGARAEGATVFLTPAGNCDAAVPATPEGLRLVKVATLDEAVTALDMLRAGRVDDLPACP